MNLSILLLCMHENRRRFESQNASHMALFSASRAFCFQGITRHNANYAQMPGCPLCSIHIILMAPYMETNNEELYLYNNDVTYYVITCNSAFEYNNDVTYYVITRNYQWTPERDPHK